MKGRQAVRVAEGDGHRAEGTLAGKGPDGTASCKSGGKEFRAGLAARCWGGCWDVGAVCLWAGWRGARRQS